MSEGRTSSFPSLPSLAARWLALFGLWCLIARHAPADFAAGALAAALAAAASYSLWPGGGKFPQAGPLLRFAGRFLGQSVVAGLVTARFAFARRPQLKPALIRVPTRCPEGFKRSCFLSVMSLQPGTMPVGTEGDSLLLHCLDTSAPIAAQVAADEAAFCAIGGG